jgi:uncharacterized protein (DUF4415 family)
MTRPDLAPDLAAPAVNKRRLRGPQKAPTKEIITIRLDLETLNKWRATGKGWQTRMRDLLAHSAVPRPSRTPNQKTRPARAVKRSP